ncbi:MAG TPA: DUF222 domain-containing protein, partial [Candidatus Dormibacteraeota bacterium]
LEAEDVSLVLGAELQDLQRLQDRLAAHGARRLAVFDRERGFAADGSCSTVAWLRGHCRLSNGAARTRVSVARQLGELPQTSAAFARGDITYAHVAGICRTADQLGTALVAGAEPILVPAARELNAGKFGYVTAYLRHTVDPDGALDDANEERRRSYLHLSETWKGNWELDGRLDPEMGATLQTAINALMPRPGPDDMRFPSQRRAEALVELARRQLDGGALPQVAGVKPHVSMITTVETLKREPGAPPADLEWGPPVHMETARRIACDCFPDSGDGRFRWRAARLRTHPTHRPARAAAGAGDARPRLRLAGLRPATGLDQRASPPALGRWRSHQQGQPGDAVRASPLARARRRLAPGAGAGRPPGGSASLMAEGPGYGDSYCLSANFEEASETSSASCPASPPFLGSAFSAWGSAPTRAPSPASASRRRSACP